MSRQSEQKIWLWTTGAAAFLLLASLVVLHQVGGESGESLYRRAEQLRGQREYDRALRHYRLLVKHHPRSEWADDALFREGEILSNRLKHHREAGAVYRELIEKYPDSPRAGDALMAMGGIAYHDLRDVAMAQSAYNEALEKFPANHSLCADALLMLGRIHFEQGKADAEKFFVTLLKDYADNKDRCAEAQFHIARIYEEIKRSPELAVAEYRKVVANFPNTRQAEDAKRALGLLYYAQAQAAQQKSFLQLTTVVADESDAFTEPSLLRALRTCLAAQGVRVEPSWLMGLSGVAFQFLYRDDAPTSATMIYLREPLSSICEAYGVRYECAATNVFKDALTRLKQEIARQHPVIIYLAAEAGWGTVVGYEEELQRVSVQSRGMRLQTYSYKQLERLWSASPLESDGKGRYALYIFSQHASKSSSRRSVTRALQAACRWMREERHGKFALGLPAYEQIIAKLQELAQSPETAPQDVPSLQVSFLSSYQSVRTAAALFLNQAAAQLSGEPHTQLLRAADNYQKVANLYKELKQVVSNTTSLASLETNNEESPEAKPPNRYEQAVQLYEQIRDLEKEALEEMEAAVS